MSSKKINIKDIIYCLILIVLVFIVSAWVLNENNFFVFDDYHNLVKIPYLSITEFFSFLPEATYCSRPVGWVIVKILLNIFGLNYLGHVIAMLIIHSVNAILVYICMNFFLKSNKNKKEIGLVTALIFALYPVSTMPSYWESAMFDLFGTTLMLIYIIFYFIIRNLKKENIKKYRLYYALFTVFSIIVYYLSLRTKEMFIAAPVALFVYSFFTELFEKNEGKIKNIKIKSFLTQNLDVIINIIVMLFYFLYTRVLNAANSYTNNPSDAYYYIFNLKVIIENFANYLFIYFNPQSLVYGDVLSIINFLGSYKVKIVLLAFIVLVIAIYKLFKKKEISYISFIMFYCAIILPVLPMPNFHANWYLYAPAIFIAAIISIVIFDIILKFIYQKFKLEKFAKIIDKIVVVFVIVVIICINNMTCIKNFRDWWINFAQEYKYTYEYFVNLKDTYGQVDVIYVINVPDEYTTLYIEDGGIINVAYDDPNLVVKLNDYGYLEDNENILVIDYNDGQFVLCD